MNDNNNHNNDENKIPNGVEAKPEDTESAENSAGHNSK